MNADHQQQSDTPQHQASTDQPGELPKNPFDAAWETWNDWSLANAMRRALQVARQRGDQQTLADFQRYPQWTQGPGPLEALAANRELVDRLTGWRWQAIFDARQQGHSWQEIGRTIGQSGEQARADYLDKVGGQRWLAELERQALAHHDPSCPPDQPPDHDGRQAGQER
jgi:hypothetical protein